MSMFSENDWQGILREGPSAPGPAAVSVNGNGDAFDVETSAAPFPAPDGEWVDGDDVLARMDEELQRINIAVLLLGVGLACIAAAMLVHLRRVS